MRWFRFNAAPLFNSTSNVKPVGFLLKQRLPVDCTDPDEQQTHRVSTTGAVLMQKTAVARGGVKVLVVFFFALR